MKKLMQATLIVGVFLFAGCQKKQGIEVDDNKATNVIKSTSEEFRASQKDTILLAEGEKTVSKIKPVQKAENLSGEKEKTSTIDRSAIQNKEQKIDGRSPKINQQIVSISPNICFLDNNYPDYFEDEVFYFIDDEHYYYYYDEPYYDEYEY